MLVVGYVLLSLLVALNGRNRRYGVVGALFMSLLMTPPLAFLILWITAPRPPRVPTVIYRTVPVDVSAPVSPAPAWTTPASPGDTPRTAGSRRT